DHLLILSRSTLASAAALVVGYLLMTVSKRLLALSSLPSLASVLANSSPLAALCSSLSAASLAGSASRSALALSSGPVRATAGANLGSSLLLDRKDFTSLRSMKRLISLAPTAVAAAGIADRMDALAWSGAVTGEP